MAKSFYICKYEKFSEDQNSIEYQLNMDNIIDPQETQFKRSECEFTLDSFLKFDAHHEIIFNKYGRANGQEFYHYIEPMDFNFYVNESEKIIIFSLKIDHAKDFVKTFNQFKNFNIEPFHIDFESIIKKVHSVTGAWFSDLTTPNMNAAAYYGENVNRSPNFEQSKVDGKLSSIQFYFQSDETNKEHKIAISRRSCIVLMDKFQDEELELRFVNKIYTTFIK
ncbi:hypothetical protein MHH70_01705 [Metasolibacillus sp. FSL H7-0170]|uniref:hypothetical protein n=1 Tax=Metasolibacillus sp. FSL H7-0170 TaxID=2921431 RepID=UPI00315847EA